MITIAFTPNENPANALSAQAETLPAAIAALLKDLCGVCEMDDWYLVELLQAIKDAVQARDNNKPATGSWWDMGCDDDAFRVDIFEANEICSVVLDGETLIAPHGAVGLVSEKFTTKWLYSADEIAEWDNVITPTPAGWTSVES